MQKNYSRNYMTFIIHSSSFENKCAGMFCNISGIFKIFRRCCSVSEDIEIDQNNLEHELAAYYIVFSGELLYNKAWDYYELDKETYKDAYRREFICPAVCRILQK